MIPVLLLLLAGPPPGEVALRKLLSTSTGAVTLPPGLIEVHRELKLSAGARDLTISGDNTVLHAASDFTGRAILSCLACRNLTIHDVKFDGNRAALAKPRPLPPSDVPFAQSFPDNGVLIEGGQGFTIERVEFAQIAGFAMLISRSKNIFLSGLTIENSGSRNARGRNNTTGGILLEEGVEDFTVTHSTFDGILGNAVWTHSRYGSPRNLRGGITNNHFSAIGRDAIQIGHASHVLVANNSGRAIGPVAADVDAEGLGTPVAIDTSGNVDSSTYRDNHFEEIDGKCIDLDGFHDGEVRGNSCVNRGQAADYPFGHFGIVFNNSNIDMRSQNVLVEDNTIEGMKYGGIFVVGSGHRIVRNTLRRLDLAHCGAQATAACPDVPGSPGVLEAGIYLGERAEHPDPARGVVIESNAISGWGMQRNCIRAAPGVRMADNRREGNRCSDE